MGRAGRVLVVAAVAVALVRPAIASGENARQPFGLLASYLRLASRYRSGDVAATGDLRGWPLLAIDTAVDALRGSPRGSIGIRVVEAAVVLEVHAGLLAQQAESPAQAQAHINAGIRVFEWSRRAGERGYWSEQDEALRPRIDPATFYATVAAGCLSLWGVVLADDVAARGLRQFPTDPQLLYIAGCVKEALVFVHTVEHKAGEAEEARRAAEKRLRDTLAVEPQNTEARLRLARVLVDEDRPIEAQPLLEGVAQASDTRLRYLAWLFLGRMHDRRQSWGKAQDAYSRAVREQPDNQAARLGLACALEQRSGPAAARPQVLDTLALSGRLDRRNDPQARRAARGGPGLPGPAPQRRARGPHHLLDRGPLAEPLTAELQRVHAAVDRGAAGGSTSLCDAVYAGLRLTEPTGRRTALVVFSDGLDNTSWLRPTQVVEAARRSDATVYGVLAGEPEERDQSMLREVSRATGGRVFESRRVPELRARFLEVLDDIRSRYVLSYAPRGVERAGWHPLAVRLKRAKGDVLARPGYWRPDEARP